MKFEIQQEDLQKALDIIANVVPTKTTLPILTCVLMEVAGDRLTLSATNLDISITTSKLNANPAMENVALWHERDITHSSVERVIIPDSCILIDYVLQKFIGVLEKLVVNKKRMHDNIYMSGGLVFSQRLLLKLAGPAGSRERAYKLVQENAMKVHENKGRFIDLIKADERISVLLTPEEIDDCFGLDYYLRNVPKIFKRVFG